MKINRSFIVLFVVFMLVLNIFVVPVLAQDGTTVVPNGTTVVEVIPIWAYISFVAAVFSGLIALGLLVKEAREGNKLAQFGLMFFEASKTMLPLDEWQKRFEDSAARTPTPVDDLASGVSHEILERIQALETRLNSPTMAQIADVAYQNKEAPHK